MRLQEVYYICKNALDHFTKPEYQETRNAAGAHYKMTNWPELHSFLDDLSKVPSLTHYTDQIYYALRYQVRSMKEITLTTSEQSELDKALANLYVALDAIVRLYDGFDFKHINTGFDVKLPDGLSLAQIAEITKDLNEVFSICPLFRQEGDEIAFVSMDIGSTWLSFAAAGTFLLNRIAAFVNKCLIIKSNWAYIKSQEAQAKMMGMGADYIENMIDMNKEFMKVASRKIAEELCSENGVADPEDMERTRYSVETFGKLMSQGLEIYSAITSSAEEKALFPPLEKQKELPGKITGMISDGTNTKDNEEPSEN